MYPFLQDEYGYLPQIFALQIFRHTYKCILTFVNIIEIILYRSCFNWTLSQIFSLVINPFPFSCHYNVFVIMQWWISYTSRCLRLLIHLPNYFLGRLCHCTFSAAYVHITYTVGFSSWNSCPVSEAQTFL